MEKEIELLVNKITNNWENIINSIEVDGYSRKVNSVNFFRMNKYYHNEDKIEWCYKVNFNFNFQSPYFSYLSETNDPRISKWHKKLQQTFSKILGEKNKIHTMGFGSANPDEIHFQNNKCDYMTNQGYRFIIQFYPQGFINQFRHEKLTQLGI